MVRRAGSTRGPLALGARGRGSRAVVLAASAALALGASACTGTKADPTSSRTSATSTTSSATSPTSSSTSTTASSTSSSTTAYVPVKPTLPAAAKEHTDAGAVAFVKYYLDVVNYAWTKPDAKILPRLGEWPTARTASLPREWPQDLGDQARAVSQAHQSSWTCRAWVDAKTMMSASTRFVTQMKADRVTSAGEVVLVQPEEEILDRFLRSCGGSRVVGESTASAHDDREPAARICHRRVGMASSSSRHSRGLPCFHSCDTDDGGDSAFGT